MRSKCWRVEINDVIFDICRFSDNVAICRSNNLNVRCTQNTVHTIPVPAAGVDIPANPALNLFTYLNSIAAFWPSSVFKNRRVIVSLLILEYYSYTYWVGAPSTITILFDI